MDLDEQAACQTALLDMAVQLYASTKSESSTAVDYSVDVIDGEVDSASVIVIEGPDIAGLLGAITTTLGASSCSIVSFSGETTGEGMIRDRFVVQSNGKPLDEGNRAPIARRLQQACVKLHRRKSEGDEHPSRFAVLVENTGSATSVTVDGPDVPGLLSKLSSALTSDGYEIIAFDAGMGTTPTGAESEGVHDVFHVTRDGAPLSAAEGSNLKQWIEQVSDTTYADAARMMRSGLSRRPAGAPRAATRSRRRRRARRGSKSRLRGLFGCLGSSRRSGNYYYGEGGDAENMATQIYELTALERKGLIAALKAKGGQPVTAAEQFMMTPRARDLTEAEIELLSESLGDAALSDGMRRAQIDPNDITIGEIIGSGAFGEVRAGAYHGTPVAIKTMHRAGITSGGLDLFKAECELCLSLRHPNIVQLIGACWRLDAAAIFHVMERCEYTLSEKLRDARAGRRGAAEFTAARVPIAIGVARALAYLHSQKPPILHRDLKPDNVLLTRDYIAKVSDFGSSRDVAAMAMTQVGTPLFAAPEIMAHEPYDGSADVWSFGCILACLYSLSAEPFRRDDLDMLNMAQVMKSIIRGTLKPNLPPADTPVGGIGFRCAQLHPDKRPAFREIVEMLQADEVAAWGAQQTLSEPPPLAEGPGPAGAGVSAEASTKRASNGDRKARGLVSGMSSRLGGLFS